MANKTKAKGNAADQQTAQDEAERARRDEEAQRNEHTRAEARALLDAEAEAVRQADLRNPVLPSLRTNPFGAAQIFLGRFFTKDGACLLISYREEWYQYKRQRWVLVTKKDAVSTMYQHLLLCRQVDAEGDIHDFVTSQPNVNTIYFQIENNETIPSDMTLPCVREPDGSWHEVDGRGKMVCRGEIVDMLTGESQPTLYTFIPNGADWRYAPDAQPPKHWIKFLDELFGTKAKEIALLQEWFGYVLSGDTWAQKGLIIVGPKRAGKGIIGHVLSNLLGDSMVASPALHAIGSRFGLENLINKRMCLISDARLSNRQDIFAVIETLLRIIGCDNVSVDRKNKGALDLKLSARIMLLSNEMPHLPDNSDAIHHRFLILKLDRSFLGNEDVHLLDTLNKELPAIANWAIEGYRRLVKTNKFMEPKSSKKWRNEWRGDTNPLAEFVKGYCDVNPGASAEPDKLTEKYNIWRAKHKMTEIPSNKLSVELGAMLGSTFNRGWEGNKRCWKGIGLNKDGKELERPF
jgi:putative DNA primase/helicase